MALIDANLFPTAAEMIYDKKISYDKRNKIKGIYIEALIHFLDIFSQTEIGEGIEIDIVKMALYINSVSFENTTLFCIKCENDIYEILEKDLLNGFPIWRFLKLSEYQLHMFEKTYAITLKQKTEDNKKTGLCYNCIWYESLETMFGKLDRCNKPSCFSFRFTRDERTCNPLEIKSCSYLTTLDSQPDAIMNDLPSFRKNEVLRNIDKMRIQYRKNQDIIKDDYKLPIKLSSEEIVVLNEEVDPISDLILGFGNKRTKTERKKELLAAMYIECLVRFFEYYSKNEFGNDFIANISYIVQYVDDMEFRPDILDESDIYLDIENRILVTEVVSKFVKKIKY